VKTDSIETAIGAIAAGRMVVVVDDENRENEGDLIMAAHAATEADIAFMVRYTSGVLCVSLPGERLDALSLPLMVANNSDSMGTAFTVSTDYRIGTTTGISAADRAITVRALVDENADAAEFNRPGHVFPLRAVRGGVLRRPGHTEAGVDLARLAGMAPGGLLAEIVNDDGTMARLPQLMAFARTHSLPIITIKDLIAYRRKHECIVERMSVARLPTRYGVFTVYGYKETVTGQEHAALVMGELPGNDSPLVRVHSECLTGEVFGSIRCDCRAQLDLAMSQIAAEGRGVIVYLKGHEGRGIGLTARQQGRSVGSFLAAHFLKPMIPRGLLRSRYQRAAGMALWATYSMVSEDFLEQIHYGEHALRTGHDIPFRPHLTNRETRLRSLQSQRNSRPCSTIR